MKILFILCCALIFKVGFSQTTTIVNQKTIGGDQTDVLTDIIVLNNGTYVISGHSKSGISGNKTTTNYGGEDMWILNLNQNFTINWQLNLGGTSNELGSYMLPTADGGLIVAGSSESPISGNKTSANKGGYDYWVIKVSNSGVVEWQETYGGTTYDRLFSIASFSDGNLLLFGSSDSPISGDKTEASRGDKDYWIVKITPTGSVIWDKTIGGNAVEDAKDVVIDNNENIYLVGDSQSSQSGEKTENNYGNKNVWVIKLDSSGSIVWDKTIGGNSIEFSSSINIMSGYIYLCADSDSPVSGNKTAANFGLNDYWLVKMDTVNGAIQWDRTFGGSSFENSRNVLNINGNQILISGSSESGVSGSKVEPNIGSKDMWAVLIDSSGSEIWQKTIGGTQYDNVTKVYRVANNHYIFAGTSWSDIGGDKTENVYGWSDYWLLELTTNLGLENVSESIHYKAYPNPSQGQFVLTGLNLNSDITIYNIQGKVIKKLNSKEQKSLNINLTDVTKGIYLINIRTNHSNKTLKLLIK